METTNTFWEKKVTNEEPEKTKPENNTTCTVDSIALGVEATTEAVEGIIEAGEVLEEVTEAGGGFIDFVKELFDFDDDTPIGAIIAVIVAIVLAVGGLIVGTAKLSKLFKKK